MNYTKTVIKPGEYSYAQKPTSVKKIVDDGIAKLETIGIVFPQVLDVAIDAFEYKIQQQSSGHAEKDNSRNPFHLLRTAHQIKKEIRDLTSDKIIATYNEVVRAWSDPKSRITPIDLLEQLVAKFLYKKNDSGLENGLVADAFLGNTTTHMQHLLINPSPPFVSHIARTKALLQLNMALAFTDQRFADIVKHHPWPSNISVQHFEKLNLSRTRDRVCIFGAGVDYETTASVLTGVIGATGTKPDTTVFLLVPTAYVDRRGPEGLMRTTINNQCNLLQVLLIDSNAINIAPKKRALVVFQCGQNTSGSFGVSKVKRNGAKLTVGDCLEIPYRKLLESRLTLDGIYKEVRSSTQVYPSKGEPELVLFSSSVGFWCTVEMPNPEKPNYRARISYYDFPTTKQRNTKKYDRGNCLVRRKTGTTVDSISDVYNCLDDLLMAESTPEHPNILAATIRTTLEKKFGNSPIDLKTLWYLNVENLTAVDDYQRKQFPSYDHQLCCKLFLGRDWEANPLCSLLVGACTQDEIETAIEAYAEVKGESKTDVLKICKQLKIIFGLYCRRKIGAKNPMVDILERISERNERKYKQKQKIGIHSLSEAKMRQFIQSLNSDSDNPIIALLAKHKAYLGISNGEAAALTIGDYIHKEDGYALSVLHITKQMEQTGTATVSYGIERRSAKDGETSCPVSRPWQRRTLSVPALLDAQLNKMVKENIEHLKASGLTDEEVNRCPLFPSADDLRLPIKTRRINEYCVRHLKKLGIQSMEVFDPDDSCNIDLASYSRDLLQANWEHHARADLQLEANLISYIRGRTPSAIIRANYCDRDHSHVLKELAVRCDKLPALFELPENPKAWELKRMDLGPDANIISPILMAKSYQLVLEFNVRKTDIVDILANFPHGSFIDVEITPTV